METEQAITEPGEQVEGQGKAQLGEGVPAKEDIDKIAEEPKAEQPVTN